jgi:hypothetical protein
MRELESLCESMDITIRELVQQTIEFQINDIGLPIPVESIFNQIMRRINTFNSITRLELEINHIIRVEYLPHLPVFET